MCGISGFLNFSQLPDDAVPLLKKMLARIQYRGPDESGIFLNNQVALGSVRLSIIDISSGQQPLSTTDGQYWIVFNGEIFNYLELRQDLVKLGHRFTTESDTEVLLHAWLQYGAECLKQLNGQFAFAIWDNIKKELFLARDRVGIRPLFYTWKNGNFVFGSEIKTLLEYPQIQAAINPLALSQVFTFWTTLSPKSVFKDILELAPGHYMHISAKKTEIKQWWQLNFPAEARQGYQGTFYEAREELRALLTDAVKLRLRADVPVAAYLSGGLDSSATTALIKKVAPDSLLTFSIGFEDGEFDETSFQQEASAYLNTKHTQFTCQKDDIANYFPQVIWHSEIPILRTAPVPMFCLSKKVSESHIKVVITGEGADEMLAGYDIFKETIIRNFWSRQPNSKYRPLLLNKLYPYLAQFKGRNQAMLKLFYGYKLEETSSPFYSHLLRWKNTSNIIAYFSEDMHSAINGYDSIKEAGKLLHKDFNSWNKLSQAQWLEIAIFMSGYLLSSQGDRMAMANSVEGRYPFLDYRVMEFAATLPPDYKMHGLDEKYILKQMMQGQLPDSILKRPKQAYRAPVSKSFMTEKPPAYVDEMLAPETLRETGLFNPEKTQKLLSKIKTSQMVSEMDNMALSGILSTQLLYTQFIHKNSSFSAPARLSNCHRIIDQRT
jgi:asparagine synthase (glutamine-hydrolysing)